MAKKGLREQLIGAWKLVSYVETPVDGSPKRFPMDENAQGNQPVYLDARADRRAHIGAVCGPSSRAALRKHEICPFCVSASGLGLKLYDALLGTTVHAPLPRWVEYTRKHYKWSGRLERGDRKVRSRS